MLSAEMTVEQLQARLSVDEKMIEFLDEKRDTD